MSNPEVELLAQYRITVSGQDLSEILRALNKHGSKDLRTRLLELRQKSIASLQSNSSQAVAASEDEGVA